MVATWERRENSFADTNNCNLSEFNRYKHMRPKEMIFWIDLQRNPYREEEGRTFRSPLEYKSGKEKRRERRAKARRK
jgi:hypothetical protein